MSDLLLEEVEPAVLHTRVKASGTDPYGQDVYTVADKSCTGIFTPGGTTEITATGDTVTTTPTFYPYPDPLPVEPTAVDAMTIRGAQYEIQGAPADWASPGDTESGQVIELRRVTG